MTGLRLELAPHTAFEVPPELFATEPPEARGVRRDEVRLLVARPGGMEHRLFRDLAGILRPGDLIVVNTSGTLPAAVDASRPGRGPAVVHFSTPLDDGSWVVELRTPNGSAPLRDGAVGETIALDGGALVALIEAYPHAGEAGTRLWRAAIGADGAVWSYLGRHGRPISYGHLPKRWPLSSYQTIFAREPGSAEMPSAARPFTHRLVGRLVAAGVAFAPIVLHSGVSSLEATESPLPERFEVPATTALLVDETRRVGGRVIAVGTTVARALETVALPGGCVCPGSGWTELVLSPDRPTRVIDGLVTGWHPPNASHLLLLEALGHPDLVQAAYDEAVRSRYLWHEFGDACLFLP
jgi:S-adenosylmethionine:tRNA ribosyltransferase-isomerase